MWCNCIPCNAQLGSYCGDLVTSVLQGDREDGLYEEPMKGGGWKNLPPTVVLRAPWSVILYGRKYFWLGLEMLLTRSFSELFPVGGLHLFPDIFLFLFYIALPSSQNSRHYKVLEETKSKFWQGRLTAETQQYWFTIALWTPAIALKKIKLCSLKMKHDFHILVYLHKENLIYEFIFCF